MSTTVTYLFDPLRGWCYGVSPAVQHLGNLAQRPRSQLAGATCLATGS